MSQIGDTLAFHLSRFGELPEADAQAVRRLDGEVRRVDRHQDVLSDGEQPTHAVVVLEGFLFRYTMGRQGVRQVHSFYLPTEAPSLETIYMDYMDNSLATAVDSRVGFVPLERLYQLIDNFPGARKLLWRQTLVQGGIFREWLIRNSNRTAHGAVAHLFCEMFARADAAGLAEGNTCPMPVTQELIGQALGLSVVHVNRTLQLLREAGLVDLRGGILSILDRERLWDAADFDPRYLHLKTTSRD
ncbi:Crp/Fnr family transcriptional regulator [Phenylobacterium sp.]|uniref:Crp/Fnr family transcriptional regulator n=1 Tax=Phenylobacterium sp. TaxID=1871053 RepID=UPI002E374467|nr:Crp/Fnr family transcriptional regulator [Phenylobacterium sp.]HEX2558772.1 Crp/Fnr family transcriptional regulator [Phenylobacterium sp.]